MAEPTTRSLHVSLPGTGKIQSYTLSPDIPVQFDFDLSSAEFVGKDGSLEIAIEGGGTVILENYQELADSGSLPSFVMLGGEVVAGDVYLFAFEGADQTAEDLETAAGANGGGSGAGEYSDDAGAMFDGLTALGGQGDAFAAYTPLTAAGVLGNVPPIANDDTAAIAEEGDADFDLGRNVMFVDGEQAYLDALAQIEGGDLPGHVSEYFPLASGGGFFIYYPNPPQTPGVIEGNVMDNDVDVDGTQALMRMVTIDHVGENHDGVDTPPVEVQGDDTVIMGKYGVLIIDSDGHWEYTLNQDWADVLNEGDTYDEVFEYTIVDGVGGESNSATLTITVTGTNDMPVAHDDMNVQAVETGDSEGYGLHASVYDPDLGEGGSQVDVHDEEAHDYHDASNTTVHGNVLAGDDAGGVADTDVDGGDSPDGQSMFVVGVYSHATQTVDYDLPGEGNSGFVPADGQTYDVAQVDPNGEVSVHGQFGTLTIHTDGSYDYQLYTADDGEAYDALNALNYNSEDNVDQFTYGIMDDSGAFSYANISFTVNGANDAPVAYADENSVVEFGIKNMEDQDYTGLVSGNVILGEDNGAGKDTDVDDTEMFVSSVSSENTEENGSLYTDDNMDPDASVTINGQYGTLTIHADGTYDYQLQNEWDSVQKLNEDDHPQDIFTYTVTNGYADGVYSNTATLTITVHGSNDAPEATNDVGFAKEEGFYTDGFDANGNVIDGILGVVGHDSDVDSDTLTVIHVDSNDVPANSENVAETGETSIAGEYGVLYIQSDGTYRYELNDNAENVQKLNVNDVKTDTFTYTISDEQGGTASAELTIHVNGSDDAPVAVDDVKYGSIVEAGVDEAGDNVAGGNVLTNDADIDNAHSSLYVISAGAGEEGTPGSSLVMPLFGTTITGTYGKLTIYNNGTYKYVLNDNDSDTQALAQDEIAYDEFHYTVNDPLLANDTATLSIQIIGSNDAAVIGGVDTGTMTEDLNVSLDGMLTADGTLTATDVDNTDNVFRAITEPVTDTHGGKFTMDASGNWHYEVSNASVQSMGNDDSYTSEFTVQSEDGTSHTVTVTVNGVNDAPIANDDAGLAKEEGFYTDGFDAHGNVIDGILGVVGHDSDVEGDTLSVTHVDSNDVSGNSEDVAETGETSIAGEYGVLYIQSDGTYRYELNDNAENVQKLNVDDVKTDTFTYTITDDNGGYASAKLVIHVNGSDDAPVAVDDVKYGSIVEAGVDEAGDNVAGGNVLTNDADIDNAHSSLYVISAGAGAEGASGNALVMPLFGTTINGTYGKLTIYNNGTYKYVLNDNDSDTQALAQDEIAYDEFHYTVNDPLLANDTATLSIQIIGTNDAAEIGGVDTGTMTEDFQVVNSMLTADGTLTASDVDNADNVFKAITEPLVDSHGGKFTMDASGTWHYEVSNASVQGMGTGEKYTSDFTVQSEDGTTHTVTVTVNGVNDAPIAKDDNLGNVDEGAGTAVSLGYVGDDNGNGADYDIDVNDSITSYSPYGDLPAGVTLTPDGQVLFDASDPAYNNLAEGHSLTVTFQYVANDGEADSAPATVTFTVTGTNDGATIDTSTLGDTDTGSVTEIDWSNDDPNKTDDFQASDENPAAQYDQFGNLVVEPAAETLHAEGHLTVSDPDDHSVGTPVDTVDEATLAPTVTHNGTEYTGSFDANGDYSITTDEGGTFTIKADGSWSYDIDNTLDVVQQLGDNQSFTETFTVESQDGTANHDVTVTVNGTNDAPVITNVSAPVEDFEDGASGWTDNTVTETSGAFTDFLGRFGKGDATEKTFEVAEGADKATIEFDVYEIDSWTLSNNTSWGYDVLTFTVNGNNVDIPLERSLRDDSTIDNTDRSGTITVDGTVIHWTFSAVTDGTQNLGFAGYEDQIHHVTITVENPGDTITLGLGSNLNEPLNNESFGIDNVAVNSIDGNGDVILTIDENVPGSVAVAQLESTDVEGQAVHYVIDQVLDADGNDVTADGLFIVDGDKILTADGVAFDYEASSKYTVTVSPVDSQGAIGQDVDITINIGDVNEPPSGEDFTMHVGLGGAPVPFLGEDATDPSDDHVSDPEDDYQALDVLITDLPDHGTLFDGDGNPVELDDLNSTHYDLNELTYVPDSEGIDGVLLGSRNSGDAEINNWGEWSDSQTRILKLDTDGDGNDDVIIKTQINQDQALKQYAEPNASHIGHGIANADHNGLDAGETITITFDGADVSYAEVGFSGLGSYFDPGSDQKAFATWEAYSDGVLVASGEVNNGMINGVFTDGGSGGDIYQTMVIDSSLLGEGVTFDQLIFGTVEHGDGNYSNWELSYVDVEFSSSDSFNYTPVDSEGLTDPNGPSTVTIDILPDAPVNQDPTAVDDTASVFEPNDLTPADTYADSVSANVLSNDIDPDNTEGEMSLTALTYKDSDGHETVIDFVNNTITVDGGAAEPYSGSFATEYGVLTIKADGSYTYQATDDTLRPGDAPTETFTYTMTDGDTVDNDATAQTADLVITVNGLNDAPVDGNETVSTAEDTDKSGNLLENASDVDGDSLHIDSFQVAGDSETHQAGDKVTINGVGTIQIDANGDYTFEPADDFNGDMPQITYTVSDGNLTDTSTLDIEVTPVNDAPVDDNETVSTAEDTDKSGNLLDNASDVDGDSLHIDSFQVAGDSETHEAGDKVTINGVGTIQIDANGDYTFEPADGFNGDVPQITYTVSDGNLTDTSTLDIEVTPVNDAPVDDNETVSVTEPDGVLNTAEVAQGNVLDNTVDPDNSDNTPNDDTPSLTSLTYTAADGTVTVVDFTNDTITVDGQESAYNGSFATDYGTLQITSNGDYTFTAAEEGLVQDYDPKEVITYTMSDEGGLTDTSTLTITVEGLNDAPVAGDDTFGSIAEGSTGTAANGLHLVGNVGTNDDDVDTIGDAAHAPDTLTYSAVDDLPAGVTMDADGNVYFDATDSAYNHLAAGETKTVSFEYQVDDGKGGTDTATAEFTVTGTNDGPTLDLSAGQVVYVDHEASYHNMLGIYEMADGVPVNPEIIMEDVQDATPGEVLTTYGDGADLHYFLVDVQNGATPQGTPSFQWNDTTGEWDVVFTDDQGHQTTYNVHFDNMDLNPNETEATFGDDPNHDYEVEVDDQLVDGYKTPGDDDDFDDILADEQPGAAGPDSGPVVFTEGDGPVHVTGAVDISDVDSDNMSSITITYTPMEGDILSMDTTGFDDKGQVYNEEDGTVTWTIEGVASKADYEAMLQTLTFSNNSDNPLADNPSTEDIENLREYTITVYDDHGEPSNSAVASVKVIAVNDGPDAVDDGSAAAPLTVEEDGSLFVNVLGNDTDPEGDQLTITDFDQNVYDGNNNLIGTVTMETNDLGQTGLVFTPVGDYNGPAQFEYTVSDGELEDTATVTIQVTPVNDGPDAVDDGSAENPLTVEEDGSLFVNVLGNDTDPEGDQLTITDFDQNVYDGNNNLIGTVTMETNDLGQTGLVFTPVGDYNGPAQFEYTVSDGELEDTATVTIQVTPVNDGPDAVDDGSAADPLTLDEDGSLFVNVLGNDTDPEGDQLTITDFDQNVYDGNNNLIGTVTMETNDLGQTGLVFTPVGDYNGPAQFEYTVSDGELEDTATVTIQVTPVNDGPDAVDDGSAADPLTLDEDGSLFVNVLGNDTDPEGDPLTITDYDHNVYDGNNNLIGTVTMETNDLGQTGLVFTPEDGYTGPAQFEYTVSDGKLTDSATVTLDVISTNHDPVTSPDLFQDLPGTANDINVVTEGGTNFESNPVNYLLIVDTSGSMSTHDRIGEAKAALYQMLDSLQEQVNISGGSVKVGLIDFDGNTEGKTITLTGDPATTGYQEGINFISGFDAYGSTNYEAAFQAANNWVTNESNGIDTEVIFMSDGAPNNTHNWQDDLATLHSNTHVTGVGIEMGSDSMKYINQVNEDGNGINLDNPKDLNGLLQDILTVTSTEGTTATGNVLDNDTDPDGDDLTVVGIALGDEANHGLFTDLSDVGSGADDADTAVVTGTYGTLTISANGVYTYVPDQPAADALSTGESRTESFTYQVSDGHGGTAEETVSFMINGADDAPVAVNDVYAGMQLTPGYHNTPVIDETNFNGTISDGVYHGDGFTISAESIHDGFIFNYWDDANVAKVGTGGLGVNNPGEPGGDETNNIDGYYDEDMIITFERPQATVTITLGDIQGKSDTPSFHVEGGTGTYSKGVFTATGNITSITIGANDDKHDSFYLESLNATAVASSVDWVSATMTPSTLTGNVLLNDFDAEDVDHVQTHGTGTELTVLGASGADGYVSLADATTDGSATSGVIHGQYGDLTLHTDGHFEYHVDSTLINSVNGPGVETFEYQITDSDGMTSMATLEFPITVAGDSSVVVGTTGNDILLGDDGDNILFGLSGDDNVFISSGHDTVTLGEGADTITIDPSYLNGGDGTMTVTDFHQGEDLFAIDHLIGDGKVSVEVSTSGVNNSDLNLVFTDLDGQHDMTVILQGVNPDMNHIPDTPEPISTGDDLNTLIQSIINSGGNHSS
ncbi:VCBS domain-containing protein [Pseudodesulfovibrio indicus]|uniref:VCBS repeat-containing protein n=1 Tax=Pseudodesulfovibrio indicus TaxID=1716143 RepID=A0A126QM78_9BACT|nr:Ig-like domain-containing protein [Pseudodesulfovibrio indicus]AMK10994.1 hypothetical protein AWY79_07645 [Pseudodesulfovibrio indicus]TDT91995.1 VCBS repeat-containing protein [Pseudodesulfovibrio indicus]